MRILAGSRDLPTRKLELRLLFEPRDLWLGVFWNRVDEYLLVYVCVAPAFPLCLSWRRR